MFMSAPLRCHSYETMPTTEPPSINATLPTTDYACNDTSINIYVTSCPESCVILKLVVTHSDSHPRSSGDHILTDTDRWSGHTSHCGPHSDTHTYS